MAEHTLLLREARNLAWLMEDDRAMAGCARMLDVKTSVLARRLNDKKVAKIVQAGRLVRELTAVSS